MLSLFRELLAIPHCTGCGAPGPEWCDVCALVLPDVQWHRIDRDLLLCSSFGFTGPIRKTILDWKELQHRAATLRMQRWFAAALLPLLDRRPELVCVPIPSSPANERFRGASVLSDIISSIGVDTSTALTSTRARRDQAGLSREERIVNVQSAFGWSGGITRPVLIIDDVVTSGATMRAAATAIRDGGGHVWAAFGLARRGHLTSVVSRPEGLLLSCYDKEVHHERNATGSHRAGSPSGSRRILGGPRQGEDRGA